MATPTRRPDPQQVLNVLSDLDKLEDFKYHPEYQDLRHRAVRGELSNEDFRRLQHERENVLDVDKVQYVPPLNSPDTPTRNDIGQLKLTTEHGRVYTLEVKEVGYMGRVANNDRETK